MEYTSINPVTMFINAGFVGKIVMALLLAASVWTWVLIVEGVVAVLRIGKDAQSARAGGPVGVLAPVDAAGREANALDLPGESIGEKRERIAEMMSRTAREFLSQAEGGLPNLAVISSVAPFVGLFGTVWGIYHALMGIGAAGQATIDKVAGPIGEALIMTALGLAVAIPAVLGYNALVRGNKAITARLNRFAHDLHAYLVTGARVSGAGGKVVPMKKA